MVPLDEPLYEYACHEGNYAMKGILGGARAALSGPPGLRRKAPVESSARAGSAASIRMEAAGAFRPPCAPVGAWKPTDTAEPQPLLREVIGVAGTSS
jgi:hypothetical protein